MLLSFGFLIRRVIFEAVNCNQNGTLKTMAIFTKSFNEAFKLFILIMSSGLYATTSHYRWQSILIKKNFTFKKLQLFLAFIEAEVYNYATQLR